MILLINKGEESYVNNVMYTKQIGNFENTEYTI